MNKFQTFFKEGDHAFNRLGNYTVESFDADGMWVRYEDGNCKRLGDFDRQMRIIENMMLDLDATLKELEWTLGRTHNELNVEELVEEAEELITPPLDALIKNSPRYDILRRASQEISGDCNVYVILLSTLSRQMRWGFHAVGRPDMPCLYVGQSWYGPEERFQMHKDGEHSSYYVRRFGLGLLPNIHGQFHSLSRDVAMAAEAALADALGELGCTVFGGH